jgi:predicted transcriptional regulator
MVEEGMIGPLQMCILRYLWGSGTRHIRQIRDAVLLDYQVTPNAIDVTIGKMCKSGLVERRGLGQYIALVAPPDVQPSDLIVQATLDRLFADYPDAVASYLTYRGWVIAHDSALAA